MKTTAQFSDCRRYRYTLERIWEPAAGLIQFIGLNPSTADEVNNDPTVRRCIRYAQDWGYGGLIMSNIFAFRATDPKVMKAEADPVGPENNRFLAADHKRSKLTIFAWGTHAAHQGRHEEMLRLIRKASCLGTTKAGYPKHPLYLRADLKPINFQPPNTGTN